MPTPLEPRLQECLENGWELAEKRISEIIFELASRVDQTVQKLRAELGDPEPYDMLSPTRAKLGIGVPVFYRGKRVVGILGSVEVEKWHGRIGCEIEAMVPHMRGRGQMAVILDQTGLIDCPAGKDDFKKVIKELDQFDYTGGATVIRDGIRRAISIKDWSPRGPKEG